MLVPILKTVACGWKANIRNFGSFGEILVKRLLFVGHTNIYCWPNNPGKIRKNKLKEMYLLILHQFCPLPNWGQLGSAWPSG